MGEERWPETWHELKAGKGCGMCANQGLEDSGWGVRFPLRRPGRRVPVALRRGARLCRGDLKHGHVVEPTQPPAEQAAGFWLETLRAGAAIERHLRPVKLNYLTLGNGLPHLHTHIVPRYADDLFPGRPVLFDFWTTACSRKTGCRPTFWP